MVCFFAHNGGFAHFGGAHIMGFSHMMGRASLLALMAVIGWGGLAQARDQIKIAGSSTVLPFSALVAEEFGSSPMFKTPLVESGGSSGGLKIFCQGIGANTIDIANSSRRMKPKEIEACAKNGVTDIIEVMIGYDGIVFASAISAPDMDINLTQAYLALGPKVPKNGRLILNPYTDWRQISDSFSQRPITFFIPGEKHGTRDVFENEVMIPGCRASGVAKLSGLEGRKLQSYCKKVRKDGLVSDIDGNYTETLLRIEKNRGSIGVFGFSFYDLNRDKVKLLTMDGASATYDNIASGQWPISRPLFFYVKKVHLGAIPGLREYVEFFLSEDMVGDGGLLGEKGLVSMSDETRLEVLENFRSGVIIRGVTTH